MAIKDFNLGANDAATLQPSPNDHYSNMAAEKATKLAVEKAKKELADRLAAEAKKKAEQDAKDLETAKSDNANLKSRVKTLLNSSEEIEKMQLELNSLRQALKEREKQLEGLSKPLDAINNLDPDLHGRIVTIAVLVPPFTTVDFGGDGGRRAHGWTLDLNNGNQHLRLMKANPSDRHSPWTIDCGGRYLGYHGGSYSELLHVKSRESGDDGHAQEWYIGRIGKGWMFQNVRYGLALAIASPREVGDGKKVMVWNRYPQDESQVFLLVIR
ncbi:hypothetical protein F5B17DRAFT_413903 [Nemania serpens]|nr:hypothetical protein F5B17DRAFT_413903 [Nemania serpens]